MRVLAFLCSLWLMAAVNAAQPPDLAFEARLKNLETGLRCLVCQNQTLADSNASLADDLRREVRGLALSGKTDDEIKSYLVARYGDFVLYKPPLQTNTMLLWLLPFALLAGGAGLWWTLLRQRQSRPAALLERGDGDRAAGAGDESEEAVNVRARGRRLLEEDGDLSQPGSLRPGGRPLDSEDAAAGADAGDVGTMVPAAGAAAELLAASDHDAGTRAPGIVTSETARAPLDLAGSSKATPRNPRMQNKRKKNSR